jgi:2-polyprenyl-6-methoxyphenol hydroxylase-like FAD-dependent oxidoreductase
MTTRSSRLKAIVVGGSLGGLFAANLLSRNGWEVDVFERVPEELAGRGAGIVTHPVSTLTTQSALRSHPV